MMGPLIVNVATNRVWLGMKSTKTSSSHGTIASGTLKIYYNVEIPTNMDYIG